MQRIEHYELTTNSDVFALNSLQKAMMLRPCWPNAGPTGGEGFAAPAGMTMRIFARIARDMQENLPSIRDQQQRTTPADANVTSYIHNLGNTL